jgi:hypothetical protein
LDIILTKNMVGSLSQNYMTKSISINKFKNNLPYVLP